VGKRKVFVQLPMGELIPQMKATEEQMKSGKRVIINGHEIEKIFTPEQLDNNYTELEEQLVARNKGGTV